MRLPPSQLTTAGLRGVPYCMVADAARFVHGGNKRDYDQAFDVPIVAPDRSDGELSRIRSWASAGRPLSDVESDGLLQA